MNMRRAPVLALAALSGLLAPAFVAQGVPVLWTGSGGDKVWTNALNWSGATPDATNNVTFINDNATGTPGPAGVSNSVVSVDAQALTLGFRNTNGFHHVHIPDGVTLTAGEALGAAADAVYVGIGNSTASGSNYTTIAGAGTLRVANSSNGYIQVSQRSSAAGTHRATLDLSGLNKFVADIFRLGVASDGGANTTNYPTGTLLLAKTNEITCSDAGASGTSIIIGLSGSNPNGTNVLRLGQSNTIRADGGMRVGMTKSSSVLDFNGGLVSPTAVFRNKAGTGPMAYWGIGDNSSTSGSGIHMAALADFTAGTVDAMVTSLHVGRAQNGGTAVGSSVGLLSFATGSVVAASVVIGSQPTNTSSGATGTVAVAAGGTLQVSGSLSLGVYVGGAGQVAGRLNVGGGTVFVSGNIADGGGTSAVNLTNAAVTVGGVIGTEALPVDSLRMDGSSVSLFLSGGTNVRATALSTGGGTNLITVLQLPAIGSYPAQFTVIKYGGAIGGSGYNFGLGNAPSFPGYLVDNAANSSVDIVITGAVASTALTWVGGVDGNWDAGATANWKDGGGAAATFAQLDNVNFDDTASNFAVNVVGMVVPTSLTVNNPSSNYTFSGAGTIAGASGLTKQGGATLTLANTGGNSFTGPIALEGGTLAIAREDSYTVANALVGGGHLAKVGSGTTIYTGVSTGFTGAVTIGGGTLQLGNGGTNGMVQGSITNLGALVFNRSDSVTNNSSISGTGTLTKQGGATLALAGVSSYTGTTLLAGGILSVQNSMALGNSAGVTVNSGTYLRLEAGSVVTNIPLLLTTASQDAQSLGPLQSETGTNGWTGPVTIGANNVRMSPRAGSTLVISGVIGSGINNYGLQVRGFDPSATLVLAASNTWLGASSIVVGNVRLANGDNRIPPNASMTIGNPSSVSEASLDLAGWNQQFAGLASQGSTMPITVTNSEAAPATLTLAFDTTTFSNRASIGGNIAVTKSGTGVQILAGANTYQGATTVSAGTLRLGAANVIPDGTGTGDVVVNGTLDLGGFSDAINGLSGTGLVDNIANAGVNTLTIGNNDGGGTFNGVIANTSGTLSVVKSGAGTITLGGVNTYTGMTTIAAGTLALGATGSIDAGAGLAIAAGGVFDASGPGSYLVSAGESLTAGRTSGFATDVVGDLVVAGTINIAGAAQPATLSIDGGLTLSNATVAFDLGTTTTAGGGVNDLIAIGPSLNLAGTSTIVPVFYGTPGSGTYTLVSGGEDLQTGDESNLLLVWPSNSIRQTAALDTSTSPGDILLNVSGSAASLIWEGTNSSLWDVTNSVNWNNAGSPDVFYAYDSVRFDDTSTNGDVSVVETVAPALVVFSNDTRAYTLAGVGKISGNVTVIKAGPGTATISLTNDYLGSTFVTGGVLRVGRVEALGATNGGTRVTEGGTLDLSSHFLTGESVTISGSGYTNQGALVNNTPSFTSAFGLRFLTLAGDAWVGGSGRFDLSSAPTVMGNGHVLNKVGTNMVCFADAVNANFGAVNISNGSIQIQNSTTLGGATNPITVVAPGQLAFYDASATNVQPLDFTGGRLWVRNGGAALSGPVAIDGEVDVRVDGTVLSLYGNVAGPGGFTKTGAGVLNLYAASNAWTGGATLAGGTVNVRATEALVGRVTNGAALAFLPGTGQTIVCAADITGLGTMVQSTPGTTLLTGTNVSDGGITISAGTFVVGGLLGGPMTINGSVVQVNEGGVQQSVSLVLGENSHATNIALGGASLNVGAGISNDLIVARRTNNTGIGPRSLFDVSALASFTANVGNLLVGVSTEPSTVAPPVGTVRLATNNTITATNIVIGNVEGSGGFNTTPNFVTLGSGSNVIQTPVLVLGGLKQSARMTLPAGGVLVLNNDTNGTELTVGASIINTSASPDDLLDVSGGTFLATLGQLIIGKKAPGIYPDGGSGNVTAKMVVGGSVDNGVTATNVVIGWGESMVGGSLFGTLIVSGGTFSVSGDVTLATLIGAAYPVQGTLALRGGVCNVAGHILDASTNAAGESRILLEGGTLDLMPAGDGDGAGVIGSASLPVDLLWLRNGTLQNVGEVNGGGVVVKDGAGTLVIAGVNTYTGPTVVSNGVLLVNGTIGAGGVFVRATGTVGGTGTIGGAVVNEGTMAPGTSVGLLTLSDAYTQAVSAVYRMEIGGAGAGGVDYDLMRATGAAALDGTLQVVLTNGFTPVAGNTFTVLTASAVSGAFATTDLPVLPGVSWQITTNAGTLLLSIVSAGSPYGDWATLHGLGPNSEAGDDDADGYNNLLEYSQFSLPTNATSTAAMGGGRTNGALQLLFARNTNALDITYIVEAASAATNDAVWQAINSNVHGTGWSDPANAVETGPGNPMAVRVTDPVTDATNRYLRLRVTKP